MSEESNIVLEKKWGSRSWFRATRKDWRSRTEEMLPEAIPLRNPEHWSRFQSRFRRSLVPDSCPKAYLFLSERTSGTSGVTLNSCPSRWIIIPCMECSRLLYISNRHILLSISSYITFGSSHICPAFPSSIPRIHALCYPELPCT